MKKILLFLVLSMTPLTSWGELPPQFVKAIHLVETGGRLGMIKGDDGKALGPLQIHYGCWKDSRVKGTYQQVTNLAYSIKVMEAYLIRYCPKAVKKNDFENMSRVWNGGPAAPHNFNTNRYWDRVKEHLPKQIIDNLSCHSTR